MVDVPGMSRQDQVTLGSMGLGVVIMELLFKFTPQYVGILLPLVFVPFVASIFVIGWWTRVKSTDKTAGNCYIWPSREPPKFMFYMRPDTGVPIDGKPGKFRYTVLYPEGEEFVHVKYGKVKKSYFDVWGLWTEVVMPDRGNTTYHDFETEHGQVDRMVLYEKEPEVESGKFIPVYDLILASGNVRAVDRILDRVMTATGSGFGGNLESAISTLEAAAKVKAERNKKKEEKPLERPPVTAPTTQ